MVGIVSRNLPSQFARGMMTSWMLIIARIVLSGGWGAQDVFENIETIFTWRVWLAWVCISDSVWRKAIHFDEEGDNGSMR